MYIVYNPNGNTTDGFFALISLSSNMFLQEGKIFKILGGDIVRYIDAKYVYERNRNIVDGATEGSLTPVRSNLHTTMWPGRYSLSYGDYNAFATGYAAMAVGNSVNASGACSVALGNAGEASGVSAQANNFSTKAAGDYSLANGEVTIAYGKGAYSSGYQTVAEGNYAHTEGYRTLAAGEHAHAEGTETIALGDASHSEAKGIASGDGAHAEGDAYTTLAIYITGGTEDAPCKYVVDNTNVLKYLFVGQIVATDVVTVDNRRAYLDGVWTSETFRERMIAKIVEILDDGFIVDQTLGQLNANATSGRGQPVKLRIGGASGNYSHTEGIGTYATAEAQHVEGKFNVIDESNEYAHIVGNGSVVEVHERVPGETYYATHTQANRSNAHTIAWDGTGWFAGDVKVGGTGQDDPDAKTLITADNTSTANQFLGADQDGNIVWENKTHWKELYQGSIWEDSAPTLVEEIPDVGMAYFGSMELMNNTPIVGERYVVDYNGVEIETVCERA